MNPVSVDAEDEPSRPRAWLSVGLLALAAFIFNTSEFVPVGLLSSMAASFGLRSEQMGLILTIYAWAVALTSLPFMLLTRRWERRRLLLAVFALFAVSHLLVAVAWNFPVLVAGRLGVAAAHAVFWSITASLAVRLAPVDKRAQALGLLALGTSVAMVLGIPLGRVIGQLLGWRLTFLLIGLLAFGAMLAMARLLPRLPSEHAGSLGSLPLLFRRPALTTLYVLTVVVVTAHFTAYSYIEPFVQEVAHQGGHVPTAVLLLFGGAGLFAGVLFSRCYRPHPARFLLAAIAVLTGCLLLLRPAADHLWSLSLLSVFWGLAIIAFGLAMQAQVLRLAADATDVAMALFSGLYNVGIGSGALLGNRISTHLDMGQIGYWGGALCLLGWLWGVAAFLRAARGPGPLPAPAASADRPGG